MLVKEAKGNIVKQFARTQNDTGSSEVQIALLSERIKQISAHIASFPKDKHSRNGLVKLVGKRRSLCNYLKRTNKESFNNLMSRLKVAEEQ